MTDEEKKATQRINYIQDFIIENGLYNADVNDMEYFSKVLNLIEKQSKEIEELKEKDDANLAYYDQIYQNGIYTGQKAVEYRIKVKIEELENEKEKYFEKQVIQHEIEVLQSLLEKE